jgi:acetylornithine deacetylase
MTRYLDEIASRLIAFDTVSSKSGVAALEYLADGFERLRFRVLLQRFEVDGVPQANLISWAGPPEPDGLIICGHIDTVPYEGQPGWERNPLRLEIGDARVWGRGTADMKIFLAHCLDAAAQLDLASLARPIVFAFTADEETGSAGAVQLAPALAGVLGEIPQPGLAWLGEPTAYEIFRAHKGVVRFTIKVRGLGGHSSIPDQGVNAIAIAGKIIETVGVYQKQLHDRPLQEFVEMFRESPYTTLNFGTISGGTASNMIAEQCQLDISYRQLPGSDPLDAYREIESRLKQLDRRDYASSQNQATIEMGQAQIVPALLSPADSRLERALVRILRSKPARGALFATDGPQFVAAGINSLICGPGELAQAHQPNESIARSVYDGGTAVVLSVLREMCGARVSQ